MPWWEKIRNLQYRVLTSQAWCFILRSVAQHFYERICSATVYPMRISATLHPRMQCVTNRVHNYEFNLKELYYCSF